MPIKRIFWSGTSNQDVHVLRGQSSRDLTGSGLNFIQQNDSTISAADYLHDNHDVTLTFRALFKGAPSAMGITVDQGTGQVTVDAMPHPLPKNNFIIEVTAADTANHVIGTEVVRVHIHTAVTSVALTPQTLTVRPAAATRTDAERTSYRFTLRATFDDGTMGDLTGNHGVAWSTTPPDRIDPDFFQLIVTPNDGTNDTITVTATLPPAFGGASATATMRVAAPWSAELNLPRATIIAGGGWPGTTLPDRTPNILFIGDGYTFADEPEFEQTVTALVHHLKTDRLVRPYDLLCTSMNFWRLFVPADNRGISFRGEVYTEVDNAAAQTFTGYVMVPPEKPPPTGSWSLGNLFYAVGLPVPADAHKSADDLRGDWAVLVDVPPTRGQVSDKLIKTWKSNATRILVDELDNFPGMAYGSPPAANDRPGIRLLTLHPFRANRSRIERLLKEVQSDDNTHVGPGLNIGAIWTLPTPRFNDTNYAVKDLIRAAGNMFICTSAGTSAASQPPDYASAREGESVTDGSATFLRLSFDNSRFVVVINPFPAGRALFAGDYVALSTRTGSAKVPLHQPSPGRFVLNMQNVAETASVDMCRTLGHELGHAFDLGDEYVEVKDAFTSGEAALDGVLNLQSEADARNDAGLIDGRRIKWDWHRARKAAVLRGTVEEISANTYRIPVIAGQARQFRKDDPVLLRVRIPGQPLPTARSVTVSKAMQIAVAPSAAATADYVVVQPAAGVTVTLGEMQLFTAGSIVFVPVGASAIPDDDAPFATLVAKNIRRVINIRHEPLYKRPTSDPSLEEDEQEPNLTALIPGLPGRPFCFKVTHKIVGLYEGGALLATGIFHPTGACVMRDHHIDTSAFCPVCRYVMVDLIDPTRHFEIDLDYDDIYPLK